MSEQGQGGQLALGGKPETGLSKIGELCGEIERVVLECSLAGLESKGRFERALTMAHGMRRLRGMISDEHMADIMELQGSRLGFRTDKDRNNGYPVNIVKDRVIEALLLGLTVVGNEFNIIADGTYVTKEGLTRLVREFPGLTDLRLDFGVPESKSGGALVLCKGSWKVKGHGDEIEATIPIKVNSGMGSDAILGKATRKLLKRIYDRLTGSINLTDGDVEYIDVQPVDKKALPDTGGDKMGFPAETGEDDPATKAEAARQKAALDQADAGAAPPATEEPPETPEQAPAT